MKLFLFIMDLIVPVVMVIAGSMMLHHPPKKINSVYGYRTARSMRNMDTWLFAHKAAGKTWMKWGTAALIASGIVQIPFFFLSVDAFSIASMVLMFIQIAVLLVSIAPVERALKREFDSK